MKRNRNINKIKRRCTHEGCKKLALDFSTIERDFYVNGKHSHTKSKVDYSTGLCREHSPTRNRQKKLKQSKTKDKKCDDE